MTDSEFFNMVLYHTYFEKHCFIAFILFYLALQLIYISVLPANLSLSMLPANLPFFFSVKADITVFWRLQAQQVILIEMELRFCSLTLNYPFNILYEKQRVTFFYSAPNYSYYRNNQKGIKQIPYLCESFYQSFHDVTHIKIKST